MKNHRDSAKEAVLALNKKIQFLYFPIVFVVVFLLSMMTRLFYASYGLPYTYGLDEPQIASTALHMMRTGDLNPHFFNYGSLLIYLNLFIDIFHYLYLMGQPETSDAFLTSLDDLIINKDTGWHWQISHPSFFYWNRILTVFFGVGSVFLVYLINKNIFNKWVGLVSALFLAVLPFHVKASAIIGVDVPVSFFILLVVYFSYRFINEQNIKHIVIALIGCGLALSTKYNSSVVIAIPFLAVMYSYKKNQVFNHYLWILIPVIPAAAFFFTTPFAWFDLSTFLRDVGYEVRHYKVLGSIYTSDEYSSTNQLENLTTQLFRFNLNLSFEYYPFLLLGLIAVWFKPVFTFILVFPFLYIFYMTGMTVNFHRNFLVIYPFLGLLFGAGVFVLYKILTLKTPKSIFPSLLIVFLVALLFVGRTDNLLEKSYSRSNYQDPRSQALQYIKELDTYNKVYITKELRIHEEDIRKLNHLPIILPLSSLLEVPKEKGSLFIYPVEIVENKYRLSPTYEKINSELKSIRNDGFIKYKEFGKAQPFYADIPYEKRKIFIIGY